MELQAYQGDGRSDRTSLLLLETLWPEKARRNASTATTLNVFGAIVARELQSYNDLVYNCGAAMRGEDTLEEAATRYRTRPRRSKRFLRRSR